MTGISQHLSTYRYRLVSDAMQANQYLVLAEINGRQVRNWIVGGIRISRILYSKCVTSFDFRLRSWLLVN